MPDADFVIRQAKKSDAKQYALIEADAYSPKLSEPAEVFLGKLLAFPAGCQMVDLRGQTVAHLICHPWTFDHPPPLNPKVFDLPPEPNVFFIHSLTIMRAFQGRGIGAALAAKFFALGDSLGYSRYTLISVQNSEAFWRRFGFAPVQNPSTAIATNLAGYGDSAQFMEATHPLRKWTR